MCKQWGAGYAQSIRPSPCVFSTPWHSWEAVALAVLDLGAGWAWPAPQGSDMWDSPALPTQAAHQPILGAGPFLPVTAATYRAFCTEWLLWVCFHVRAGNSFLDRVTVMLMWQNNSTATGRAGCCSRRTWRVQAGTQEVS